MDPILIRKVEVEDLALLREISIKTFTESFGGSNSQADMAEYVSKSRSPEQILNEFSNPESSYYFAVSGSTRVGYLKLNVGQAQIECKDENSLEIQQIFVDKEFQNRRIGQLLLDNAIQIASSGDFEFVWLGVWERNVKAIKFYERNGFEKFGAHSFALGSDLQTDLLMKLKL